MECDPMHIVWPEKQAPLANRPLRWKLISMRTSQRLTCVKWNGSLDWKMIALLWMLPRFSRKFSEMADAITLELFKGGRGDSMVASSGVSRRTGFEGSVGASTVNPDCPIRK